MAKTDKKGITLLDYEIHLKNDDVAIIIAGAVETRILAETLFIYGEDDTLISLIPLNNILYLMVLGVSEKED